MGTSVPSSMIQIRREKEGPGPIRKDRIGHEEGQNLLPLAVDVADQGLGKVEEKEKPVPGAL